MGGVVVLLPTDLLHGDESVFTEMLEGTVPRFSSSIGWPAFCPLPGLTEIQI